MNIFKRGAKFLGQQLLKASGLSSDELYMITRGYLNNGADTITSPYTQHATVYACAKYISRNIASVPVKLFNTTSDKEVTSGASYDLLRRVNANMSPSELMAIWSLSMSIHGECMFWLDFGSGARFPQNIFVFDPSCYKEVVSNDGRNIIVGWKLRINTPSGGTLEFNLPYDQVVHFKYPNPHRSYNEPMSLRGLSPIKAAMLSIESDHAGAKFNQRALVNDCMLSAVLETDQAIDGKIADELRRRFKEKFCGPNNAREIPVMSHGLKLNVQNPSLRDMQYATLKKMTREDVAMCYGVAMDLLVGDATYQNRTASVKAFWTLVGRPDIILFCSVMNSNFFPIYDKQLQMVPDFSVVPELQEDLSAKIKDAKELWSMSYPLNMINDRLKLGMERVSWGDEGYISPMVIPAGTSEAEEPKEETEETAEKVARVIEKKIMKALGSRDAFIKTVVNEKLSEQFITDITPTEKAAKESLQKFWFEQRSRVLKKLADIPADELTSMSRVLDAIFDEKAEASALDKVLAAIWKKSLTGGVGQMQRYLRGRKTIKQTAEEFIENNSMIAAFLRSKEKRATDLTATMRKSIGLAIAEGIEDDLSPTEINEKVKEQYNIAKSYAPAVVRTEVVGAVNLGRAAVMRDQGFTKHRWVTALDEFVRPTHQQVEDKVVEIGERFPVVDLEYPGDESGDPAEYYNCRCTTIPVEETEEE